MAVLYFVDGYHGGIRGHMPEGSWQDILHALERWPDWKISLEIEPESWEYLRQHDLHTYQRIQAFVSGPATAHRVEFISGSYAQPFCWAVNGESNIRHLLYGIRTIQRHFPSAVIDTYAVQEPCFTSMLPQILRQLGYRCMSLKNPTAWGGYMAKMPGEIVHLRSADGSTIPAVPRYECEELISCNATEASGYDFPSISAFAEKCASQGIKAPVGMCLQDLGWSSAPLVRDIDVEYVTWREYFERFGSQVHGEVTLSQEDVLVALPWGNRILQEMLHNVRMAENRILQTEKLLAIAETEHDSSRERLSACRLLLDEAWQALMQAQHHDGYICATCGEGTRHWGFQSNCLTVHCHSLLDRIAGAAQEAITGDKNAPKDTEGEIWLRVTNTVGHPRSSQAEVALGLDPGVHSLRVYDSKGAEVPCQYCAIRQYADGGIGTAQLRFEANHKGIGYECYRVVPSKECRPEVAGIAHRGVQNTVEVKTELLHLVFDLTKGGCLVRFLDRVTNRDYAGSVRGFGSLRGYSISEDMFVSNVETVVECEFLENGPLCCRLRFTGSFHGIAFTNTVVIRSSDPRVDFETNVRFAQDTDIGFPYEPKPEETYLGTHRSSCREDYKLGIQLPLGEDAIRVTKSAPFDVYESALKDTRFNSWDTIQHNILNGYADFYQESTDTGFAVFCDGVSGYSLADGLFSLTLAFGFHGNFWWGYQPARGSYTASYSLLPHSGNWEAGTVPFEDAKRREPLLVQRLPEAPDRMSRTVLSCENPAVETVTVLPGETGYQVRLFHAGSSETPLCLHGDWTKRRMFDADLRGTPSDTLQDHLGKLEIRTLSMG